MISAVGSRAQRNEELPEPRLLTNSKLSCIGRVHHWNSMLHTSMHTFVQIYRTVLLREVPKYMSGYYGKYPNFLDAHKINLWPHPRRWFSFPLLIPTKHISPHSATPPREGRDARPLLVWIGRRSSWSSSEIPLRRAHASPRQTGSHARLKKRRNHCCESPLFADSWTRRGTLGGMAPALARSE